MYSKLNEYDVWSTCSVIVTVKGWHFHCQSQMDVLNWKLYHVVGLMLKPYDFHNRVFVRIRSWLQEVPTKFSGRQVQTCSLWPKMLPPQPFLTTPHNQKGCHSAPNIGNSFVHLQFWGNTFNRVIRQKLRCAHSCTDQLIGAESQLTFLPMYFLLLNYACCTWCNKITASLEPFSGCLLKCAPSPYLGAFRANLWPCTQPPSLQ